MRNFSLGVDRRNIGLFVLGSLAAFGLTVVWHLFLVEPITNFAPGNAQRLNKYVLTFLLFGLSGAVTLASLALSRREGRRAGLLGLVPGLMVRFGLALQIFGTVITPVGLYYAADPTRSVPVGFAAFTMVFLGLFVAGFGGNMFAPRRA